MRTLLIEITPSKAAEILERNVQNRKISYAKVDQYSRDMASGNWEETHEGIAFAEDGTLIDGQHRLLAIVKTGCAIKLNVTYGMSDSARTKINSGKPRSIKDQFTINRDYKYPAVIASVTRSMALIFQPQTKIISFSESEGVYLLRKNNIDDIISMAIAGKPKITVASMLASFVIGCEFDRDIVMDFAQATFSGTMLKAGDPEYALRNFMLQNRVKQGAAVNKSMSSYSTSAMFSRIKKEKVKILRPSESALDFFKEKAAKLSSEISEIVRFESRD